MNSVDFVVIAIVAISALIAFLRGFVREVLTIGSWLGALLVTLYGFSFLQPKFEQWISSKVAADIACGVSLFLVSLVIFSIVSHMVSGLVRGSALTAVDRSLGLVFGLVRGAILVSLAYMLITWMGSTLFEGARTAPIMAKGADILRNLAPKELGDQLPSNLRLPPSEAAQGSDPKQTDPAQPAYNKRQNDALQRLIEDAASRR
jgi:membrane protein required for colicin V production